jgi:hypothetical protein
MGKGTAGRIALAAALALLVWWSQYRYELHSLAHLGHPHPALAACALCVAAAAGAVSANVLPGPPPQAYTAQYRPPPLLALQRPLLAANARAPPLA